jgi:ABC-type nitrate/sulfonate/bicarbonate transport system ATPase subunit
MSAEPPIVLEDVSKAFWFRGRVVRALQDVSLRAGEGEFVTLIGPSGCGKSTLLNIVAGLMEPDQGRILLHGDSGVRRLGRVGYMPQRDLLLPWRTVMENIILGPEIAGRDLDEARVEARDLLPLFGLEGFENSYPHMLSGGMRQRAALMRTFLCKQEIILLDEPLGALDALTRRAMRRWLLDVWNRLKHTLLFVTHDVDEAVYLSDRVYVLSQRPGTVIRQVDVDLARPRQPSLTSESRFIGYRDELLGALGL